MFILLQTVSAGKGFFRRKRNTQKINSSPLETCRTKGGLPFYIARVCFGKHGINWAAVSKKCGRRASKIVAPRNIDIPDSSGFVRYIPKNFGSLLLFNSAVNLLEEAKVEPQKMCITVCDRNGIMAEKLNKLPPYASVIRVVTASPERYAAACYRAYDEFGAVPVIRSTYEPTDKKELIIACDGYFSPLMKSSAIVTGRNISAGKLRIKYSGITLKEEHSALLPENTEAVDFAGALTELCICSDYIKSSYESAEIRGADIQHSSPAEAFREYVKG